MSVFHNLEPYHHDSYSKLCCVVKNKILHLDQNHLKSQLTNPLNSNTCQRQFSIWSLILIIVVAITK